MTVIFKALWAAVMSLIATPFLFFMLFLEAGVKGIEYSKTNAAAHLLNLIKYLEDVIEQVEAYKEKYRNARLQKVSDLKEKWEKQISSWRDKRK